MSLNWREIDCILAELDLPGYFVQEIVQPDWNNLILKLYRTSGKIDLLICLKAGMCRLHATTHQYAKANKAPRFMEFLRARLRNGRIVEAYQIGQERIVRLCIRRGGENILLWIRCWSGAANIVATTPDCRILDACFRRPRRGEVSGELFLLPEPKGDVGHFAIRPSPPGKAFNGWIDDYYHRLDADRDMTTLRLQAGKVLRRQVERLQAALGGDSSHGDGKQVDPDRLVLFGRLIMANAHRIAPGERWLSESNVEIGLEPQLSPYQNAERYFRRARKVRAAARESQRKRLDLERALSETERRLERIDSMNREELIAAAGTRGGPSGQPGGRVGGGGGAIPGLQFESGGFRILVGRTAAENDALLRNHTRGNDVWLHVRDWPGSYAFVKTKAGKSVPLDILLDAANLALFYSKARRSGRADLYYTAVKHLRRVKGGRIGQVLPTHEKNLSIRLDEERLARLRQQTLFLET